MRTLPILILTCALAAPSTAQHPVYDYSDGEADFGVSQLASGTTVWVSEFDTNDASLSADEVVVAASARYSGGSSGGIAVYMDGAGTGNPVHLTGSDLLGWRTWKVQDATATYQEPVVFCPGLIVTGTFFVVAWAAHNIGDLPAPVDLETAPNGRQYIGGVVGVFDPTDPQGLDFPFATYLGGVFVMSAGRPADVIRVDLDAVGDGDGTSWADAFSSLQDALCIARSGDQVWVAEGTYVPDDGILQTPGSRCETFLLENGVEVYGGFDGSEGSISARDVNAHPTVLSGDLAGDDAAGFANYADNSANVLVAGAGIDATAVLDGFTVRGGHGVPAACGGDRGGGMRISGASPTLRWNTFRENDSSVGGALSVSNGSAPAVESCRFEDNHSEFDGGAVAVTSGSTPAFVRSVFLDNSGRNGGAVVLADGGVDAYFESCEFLDNSADELSTSGEGGAIDYRFGSHESATVVNSTFDGNRAYVGGGIYQGGELTVINSTFNQNVATWVAGGIFEDFSGNTDIANSIFYNNQDQSGETRDAQLFSSNNMTVTYSCVEQWIGGGAGMTSADPQFEDENNYDLRVEPGSPCEDAGDDSAVPSGLTEDLDGEDRIAGTAVDMGAYELNCQSNSVSYCTAGTSYAGCQALLSSSGTASLSQASGFQVIASGVESQKDGIYYYGQNGRQASSWGGCTSYMCVRPPVQRSGLMQGGGSAGVCSGSFSKDFNAYWNAHPQKAPVPGTPVQMQLWYRDPQSTCNQTTALSDGLEFLVCP